MKRRKLPLWIPMLLIVAAIALLVLYFGAYQNIQREASTNAQALAAEIRLTVEATLTK